MAVATGVAKQLVYKVQSALGTKASASSAQSLRRVTSGLELTKSTFQSNEIRTDYQISDFRHGSRSVAGPIDGELSPGSYEEFFESTVRRDFAAVSDITGASITISGGSAPYTVTRGSGSFLTDGIKVGDVIRLSVGSLDAANINKNLHVASVTALALTVYPLNGSSMTAEGPIASTTVGVVGKKTYVPETSHTNKYYTVEHWYSDISQSETFIDCKVNTTSVNITPTGMATVSFGFLGRNMDIDSSQYFTSPTAATTTGVTAGANGILMVSGVKVGNVTGISIDVNGNMSTEEVVGTNVTPDVFAGSVTVSGQLTILFEDATYTNMFADETEASVSIALTTDNTATADFIAFTMPRIKVGGSSKDDGQKGIVQTLPFTALLDGTGGSGTDSEKSTLVIQDSTV